MSIADTHRKNIPFLSSNSRKVVIGIDVCYSDKIKGWSVLTQMWLTFIPIVSPHLESYVCPLFNGNMPAYIVYMTHSPIVFCIGRSNESRRQNMVICRNSLHFDISSSFFLDERVALLYCRFSFSHQSISFRAMLGLRGISGKESLEKNAAALSSSS